MNNLNKRTKVKFNRTIRDGFEINNCALDLTLNNI